MTLRVLIVEDVADDAELVVRELSKGGREVDWRRVESREELSGALDERWDVVVADYSLPLFGGLEALALLAERRLDIPLVMVSGAVGEEAAVATMRAGARDFISKEQLARLLPVVEREIEEGVIRRHAAELERALLLRAKALDSSSTGLCVLDADGLVEWANPAFARLGGGRLGEVGDVVSVGLDVRADSPLAIAGVLATGVSWKGELTQRRPDGSSAIVHRTIERVLDDGGQAHALVIQEDVTAQREAEARIAYFAEHDTLTGLTNRRLFEDRLEHSLAVARRTSRYLAVVFLDLDRFKEINDTLGHRAGDDALRIVAERLQGGIRESDAVARFGGDEFVFAFADLADPADAASLARKLLQALEAPVVLGPERVEVAGSAGIAIFPTDDTTVDGLLRAADSALYRAKEQGGGVYRFFAPDLNAELKRNLALERGLRTALATTGLVLEYQVQVDARDGAPSGVEALVRWGSAAPAELVRVAEESGLIVELDEWVLRTACRQAAIWNDGEAGARRVAVNVSPLTLRADGLVGRVERLLEELDLPGERLEIEVAERALIRDVEAATDVMTHLRSLGVRVTIDDFGTGWSSLADLGKLPLDRLKIDRSFVCGIGRSRADEAVVRATIGMAHSLGLDVVGEGVETVEQLAFLQDADCDGMQGFLFSRALPPLALEQLLARSDTTLPHPGEVRSDGGGPREPEPEAPGRPPGGPPDGDAPPGSICFVSTYPPTRCGLATFTASLVDVLGDPARSGMVGVVSCVREPAREALPAEIVAEWVRGSSSSLEHAAAVLNGFDTVIVQHEFGIFGGADGGDILDLVACLSAPVIVVLHTVSPTPTPNQRAIVEQLARSERVLVQTEIARTWLLRAYDVDPGRVAVVPHGARPNIGPPHPSDPDRRPVILTWGLLSPGKGIEFAIEAVAALGDVDPRPRYVVLGQTHPNVLAAEGESYRRSLESLVERLGVGDIVEFEDEYDDLHSMLAKVRAADIVLLPYRSHDQVVSGVLVEAIASGKPVVATAFPHAVELLGEGSGVVVPNDDSEAIADALRVLLTDPEVFAAAEAIARRQAGSLSWERVGRRYRRLANAVGVLAAPVAVR